MWPCSNVIIAIYVGLVHLQGVKVSSVLLSFGPCQLLTHIKALSMGAKSPRRDKVYVENVQITVRKKFPFLYQWLAVQSFRPEDFISVEEGGGRGRVITL